MVTTHSVYQELIAIRNYQENTIQLTYWIHTPSSPTNQENHHPLPRTTTLIY